MEADDLGIHDSETKNNMLANPMIDATGGRLQPVIRVDGPYGSASEEVFDYNTLMLVGCLTFLCGVPRFFRRLSHAVTR